jgi:hypothetical protein
MSTGKNHPEKRLDRDRRIRKIPPLKYLLFGGRREGNRRETDNQGVIFVDKYHHKYLAITLGIIILSLFDGFFTIYLLGHGAQELNPVMDYLLCISPWAFLLVKFTLTAFGVFCILILSNTYFKPFKLKIGSLFPLILAVMVLVLLWQVSLKFSMAL